jgi:hypothetical protein
VVQRRKRSRKFTRWGRRSGKGEKITIKLPLHIRENIPTTIEIIATYMATLRKMLETTSIAKLKEPQ